MSLPDDTKLVFSGSPTKPDAPEEQGRWRKFCKAFLAVCNDLADAASGSIQMWGRQQSANLRKTESEVTVNNLQARKLALDIEEQIRRIETAQVEPVRPKIQAHEVSRKALEAEIREEISALQEKMEHLRLLRGAEITIENKKPVGGKHL